MKKIIYTISIYFLFMTKLLCSDFNMEKIIEIKNNLPFFKIEKEEYNDDILEYFSFYDLNMENSEHYFGKFQSNHYNIASHFYVPKNREIKGTVFIMHGYLVHVGYLSNIIKTLLEKNYAVIAYDMPGHGLSSGEEAGIEDFGVYSSILNDFIIRYKDNLYGELYILGHSTGCSAIIDYTNKYEDVFKKRILLAPLIHSAMWKLSKFGCGSVGIFIKRVPRFFRNSSSNEEYINFQRNIDPIKTTKLPLSWTKALYKWNKEISKMDILDKRIIVLQGEKDGVLDWEYNMKFLSEKYSNIETYYFKNAKHDLFNEKADVQKKVYKIIIDELGNKK